MAVIYFVQHHPTSNIKIGMTMSLPTRLNQLREIYGEIELLGLMHGGYDTERALHRHFKPYRVTMTNTMLRRIISGKTEWFKSCSELLRFISHKTRLTIPMELFAGVRESGNNRYIVTNPTIVYAENAKCLRNQFDKKDSIFAKYVTEIEQQLATMGCEVAR